MQSTIRITPVENAQESLNRLSQELQQLHQNDFSALKGTLNWGWHAIGYLAYIRLQPARDRLDPWIQDYLHEGEPAVDVKRDARWEERDQLSLLEILDLLSETELPSLKPEFYQGWQDRISRCRGLRQKVTEIIGSSINEQQRDHLLLLLAVYHRLVRLPAEVSLDTNAIQNSLPALFDLAEMLIDSSSSHGDALLKSLAHCREVLK